MNLGGKGKTFLLVSIISVAFLSHFFVAYGALPNIVPNPSFETSGAGGLPASWLKGGYGTNTRVFTYPVAGFEGQKAIKLDVTSYTNGDAKWYFLPVPASAGKKYSFSDWYTSTTGSYVTIQFQLADGSYKYTDIGINLPASPSWKNFQGTFTTPANTVGVAVFHLLKSVGSITLDNVLIRAVDVTPPTVSISNPTNGASFDKPAQINIDATASDNDAISSVQFFVDGVQSGNAFVQTPYSTVLDSNTFSLGSHSVFAVAKDATGNYATSSPVQFSITTPPPATGNLTVNVTVVNDDVGTKQASDFPAFVNGTPITLASSTAFATGGYDVSETTDSNYTVNYSGDCDSLGHIVIAVGDNKICTITNNDIPLPPPQTGTITTNVFVINDNGGVKQVSDFPILLNGFSIQSGVATTVATGAYSIGSISDPDYTKIFSLDCDQNGNITLVSGDTKNCGLTYDDLLPVPPAGTTTPPQATSTPPTATSTTLLLQVTVLNNDGGTKIASDFQFSLNGNLFGQGVATELSPGSYSFVALLDPDYNTSFSGDCASDGTVTLASGENKICTALVDDIPPPPRTTGTITVNTIVINDSGGTKTVSNFPSYVDTTFAPGGVATVVDPGTHFITEISDPSYAYVISGDCDALGNITITAGQDKVCTITNDDVPNLIPNPSVEIASTSKGVPNGVPLSWYKGGYGTNTRVLSYPVSGLASSSSALKTTITSYTSGDAKWYFENVPVTALKQYTFGELYNSTVQSAVTVQILKNNGQYSYVDLGVLSTSTTTQLFTKTFTVPSGGVSLTIFHVISAVGTLTTDAFELKESVPLLPPPHDPLNLLQNASLTLANPSQPTLPFHWNKNGSGTNNRTFTYPVSGYDASPAGRIDVTSYTSGDAKWTSDPVPVLPGEEYRLSDYYMGSATSTVTIQFALLAGGYQYLDLETLVAQPSWKKFEDTFIVPPGVNALSVFHLIKGAGSLTVDNFDLRKLSATPFTEGMISLTFDDGLTSFYQNAMPILASSTIRSTQYIISGLVGTPGFMSSSSVQTFNNAGNEIGTHTKTHPYLTRLSPQALQSEIVGAKSDITALGFTPNTTFAYPYGDYNDLVLNTVKNAGFSGARSSRVGYNTKNSNPHALFTQHVEVITTIPQVQSWIDSAIANKTWLILELHDTDYSGSQYSHTPQTLQAIVNYIKQSGIKVVTNAEGLALMGY